MKKKNNFEVIIIGGSYAGLSAAMALGRSLRNVLIIDSGTACNRQTPYSHNFITQDGKSPTQISKQAKKQVQKYVTVEFYKGMAIKGSKTKTGFTILTQSGALFNAKKLLFATGIKDIMPDIEGFSQCWGISVIHCPYCHGYEVKKEITGILDNGDGAMHYAALVSNLTAKLTIYTNGPSTFTDEQRKKLKKHHIKVNEAEIDCLAHKKGQLQHIIFKNGSKTRLTALYAKVPFSQHSAIAEKLGCRLTDQGFIDVSAFQQTNIQGVFACGDNSSYMRSVANAVATGNLAGAMLNKELCEDSFLAN